MNAMAAPGKCFLVTGPPGVGKTTLVMKVFESLKLFHPNLNIRGFYTREIRQGGERVGFEVVTLDGRRGPLASTTNSRIIGQVSSWVLMRKEFQNLQGSNLRSNWRLIAEMSHPLRPPVMEIWSPPPVGHFKLNFDGSAFGCPGPAGFGGVIHDEKGNLLLSYARPIGIFDSTTAELLGQYNGLKLFKQKLVGPLCVEGDSVLKEIQRLSSIGV